MVCSMSNSPIVYTHVQANCLVKNVCVHMKYIPVVNSTHVRTLLMEHTTNF